MLKNLKLRSEKLAGVQINRSGVLTVELLVTAVALISVITFFTTCSFQIHLVWKDIRHQRIGMEELNNQLESITLLNEAEAQLAIDTLTPSATCENSLQHPELTGSLNQDLLGTRVTLQLNWDKRHPGKPLEISGWIPNTPQKLNPQSQSSMSLPTPRQPSLQWVSVPQRHSNSVSSRKEAP